MIGVHHNEPSIYPGKRLGKGDNASFVILVIVDQANAFALTTILAVNMICNLLPLVSDNDYDLVDFLNVYKRFQRVID